MTRISQLQTVRLTTLWHAQSEQLLWRACAARAGAACAARATACGGAACAARAADHVGRLAAANTPPG